MTDAIKYFVFNNMTFLKVNETEYTRWHDEEWNKYEPPMYSKLIGGIVYTAQTFYHGDVTKGNKLKPFTIYYIEGNKHRIRYFRSWLSFKWQFEKLISKLQNKEIKYPGIIKLRRNKVSSLAAIATIRK